MWARRWTLAGVTGLTLLAPLACQDRLRPGFCEQATDCLDGQYCDLEGRTAFRRCLPVPDGGPLSEGGAPPLPSGTDGPPGSDDGSTAGDGSGSCPEVVCPVERPVCLAGACVECGQDGDCTDPARGFCSGNACVDCRTGGAAACAASGRVCDPATGGCAECLETAHCKTPGKAFCANKICVGCVEAGAGVCKAPSGVCDPASGACVECTASATCTDAKAPFCSGNRCVGCGQAAPQTCGALVAARPVCAPDGSCVECTASAECARDASKPICVDRICQACTSDAQCVAKLGANPGVCLRHLIGRCATDAETIYVKRDGTCGTASGAGTAAMPLCAVEGALPLVTATRNLVVARGLLDGFAWTTLPTTAISVIGQSGAVLAGGIRSGVRLSGNGSVYLRGLTVSSSEAPGIWADRGATLRLENVAVDRNRGGGILLDGARFDIRDTRVTGNGIGETGAVIWGGVLVKATPTGGPGRLERVSIVSNQQSGLTCDAPIEAVGVHARSNAGGVDVAASCSVTTCPLENATCGSVTAAP
jgi:hypothetical protein